MSETSSIVGCYFQSSQEFEDSELSSYFEKFDSWKGCTKQLS